MWNLKAWGFCALILVGGFVESAYAQQSTPQPTTDYTPAAPGALSSQPTTPQSGSPTATSEAQRSFPLPESSGSGQVAPSATPATPSVAVPPTRGAAAPLERPALDSVPLPRSRTIEIDRSQRGELGVWLVENGGPGVEIRRVTPGSAADQAGLQAGDVILQVNGQEAISPQGVARSVSAIPSGEIIAVQFWRNGQTEEIEVLLQPAREYQAAYRGGDPTLTEMNRAGGDLEIRTARLEEQLVLVMQELTRMRQELAQLTARSATDLNPVTERGTTTSIAPSATAPAASASPVIETESEPAGADDGFGVTPTETTDATLTNEAAPPADTTPATPPAAESDDPFDAGASEAPQASESATAPDTTPTADAPPADSEAPATESTGESDDLFE